MSIKSFFSIILFALLALASCKPQQEIERENKVLETKETLSSLGTLDFFVYANNGTLLSQDSLIFFLREDGVFLVKIDNRWEAATLVSEKEYVNIQTNTCDIRFVTANYVEIYGRNSRLLKTYYKPSALYYVYSECKTTNELRYLTTLHIFEVDALKNRIVHYHDSNVYLYHDCSISVYHDACIVKGSDIYGHFSKEKSTLVIPSLNKELLTYY